MEMRMERPIERGWQTVLDNAPTPLERAKAEIFRDIFYGGASWLWQIWKGLDEDDNDEELTRFIKAAIETEFKQWRSTRGARLKALKKTLT